MAMSLFKGARAALPVLAWLFLTTVGAAASPVRHAVIIEMPDHVALAADVIVPPSARHCPAILVMTPYGRATRMSQGAVNAFTSAGFALVFVDMRGTGASQGHVDVVFSRQERADIADILKWIARQPWSDGRVVATGISYDANLAALAVATGSKTLIAAVPRFIDFDTYRDLAIPGGVRNEMLLREWGALTETLNRGTPCLVDAAKCATDENVSPIDGDRDYSLLRRALLDHQKNWNSYIDTEGYAFDDDVTPGGVSLRDGFLSARTQALARSHVPVQIWGSWFDAATADSALRWYAAAPKAPIELYLGAWSHGGGRRVDPLAPGAAENEPGAPVPARTFLDFVQRAATARIPRAIFYYTSGAAVWRRTASWPPPGLHPVRSFLGPQGTLGNAADPEAGAADTYKVDFAATTGKTNRWTTQLGGGTVDYGDRNAADGRLLTYTSAPLERDIEITGAPVVALHLASSYPDGALFAYLETVRPDGSVAYLTEGELRLALRGGPSVANRPEGLAPSFSRSAVEFLRPGQVVELAIPLHTVSAMIPKGFRLRIAIAGADADTFARYPATGDPTITIFRSAASPSYVDIPQADWTAMPHETAP